MRVEGHDWSAREFGYRHVEDSAALGAAFVELHEPLLDAVREGLGALAYTQLSDVEDELNGCDPGTREVLKIDPESHAGSPRRCVPRRRVDQRGR